MTTNLTLGAADKGVLLILAVLFIVGVRIAIGFFQNKK